MIETPRLRLRIPVPTDRAALHAMWADPEVMALLGPVKDAAGSDATLAKHDRYRREGLGFWSVELIDDGAVIGFCGLKRGDAPHPIAGEVETGWLIARPYWRRGYAEEATRAAIGWGWAHFNVSRIVAITAAINGKSRALMTKIGMRHLTEGDFNHALFAVEDPRRHTVTYAINRPA